MSVFPVCALFTAPAMAAIDGQRRSPHIPDRAKLANAIVKLFKLANVPNGHAHRFRDTFAVELLLAGVSAHRTSPDFARAPKRENHREA
jgi:integrase